MTTHWWSWLLYGLGAYFALGAGGMLFYSKAGKLALRERLLDRVDWAGPETVLDVGCGRGLLTVGAARRITKGSIVGVDVWNPRALTGNRLESVLENARRAGVADRVRAQPGDARRLPFADATFDVVVSNFVLHELQTRSERQQMTSEIARVLKPGGQVALVDFIFTEECAGDLRSLGLVAERSRDHGLAYWIPVILNLGLIRNGFVVARKPLGSRELEIGS